MTEKWKKLLRTARNRRILHMAMEWMNERLFITKSVIMCLVWFLHALGIISLPIIQRYFL
jgi:hypothetical protein